jgi:hypothetical protein
MRLVTVDLARGQVGRAVKTSTGDLVLELAGGDAP